MSDDKDTGEGDIPRIRELTADEARAEIDALLAKATRPALLWALSTLPIVMEGMRPLEEVIDNAGELAKLSPWADSMKEDGRDWALTCALWDDARKRKEPWVMTIMKEATVNAAIFFDVKRADDIDDAKRKGRYFEVPIAHLTTEPTAKTKRAKPPATKPKPTAKTKRKPTKRAGKAAGGQ